MKSVHKETNTSSSSPPLKKFRIEDKINVDIELESIINDLKEMEVDESTNSEPVTPLPEPKQDKIIPAATPIPEIKEEEKIPAHLTNILKMKGINIHDYKLIRVGGGGKCGANCISLHTTGTEKYGRRHCF